MNILHYIIGFPPERSGGLPRYATDLMNEQVKQGNKVYALFPGRINLLKKETYIREVNNKVVSGVTVFELFNSLPIPLFGGIKEPSAFMNTLKDNIYTKFLSGLDIDAVHIHTLMGIHKEFFEEAKKKGLRLIYTTHDYFGISPVPNFYQEDKSWDENNTNEFWLRCSENAFSKNKLRIFQLSFYPIIRKVLNSLPRKSATILNSKTSKKNSRLNVESFELLREYYLSIFELIDLFHFNSFVSKKVFKKTTKVISITNASIINPKRNKTKKIIKRVAYIGPYQESKGFYDFLKFAKKNNNGEINFVVYGGDKSYKTPSYVENKGRYTHSELNKVFSSIDLVLIPSKWKETFCFLTLEALSLSTPVMVSENVGSSMLLLDKYVFSNLEKLSLPKIIEVPDVNIKTIEEHCVEMLLFYNKRNLEV